MELTLRPFSCIRPALIPTTPALAQDPLFLFLSLSRSFQKQFATSTFSEWVKEDSPFEMRHKDFPVAFKHPQHGGPVFNMSDPVHLLKKVVNALWHSGLPEKQRDLKNLSWNQATEEFEWVGFSLKTLEKVWKQEEAGGGFGPRQSRLRT